MKYSTVAIIVVVVALASAAMTRYYFPQIEMKTQTVEVTKEVVKNNVQTVIKEVVKTDGTKETTTTIDDRTTKIGSEKKRETVQIAAKKDWMLSVSTDFQYRNGTQSYELQVQRRILGPFYLGAKASTNSSLGVSVGMEF